MQLTMPAKIPLIINDHAEIARRVAVQGVHVGQDDLFNRKSARADRTAELLVGKSTHSVEQAVARRARRRGLHRLRPTLRHSDQTRLLADRPRDIREVHAASCAFPIFCIGGIKLDNLAQVIAAGAKRVVIVSGLLQADDIAEYAALAKSCCLNPNP